MAEPIKINTSKYTKEGKVDVDGNIWTIRLPGAGSELRFSQASRGCKLFGSRITKLDVKIDNGTVTDAELDDYEEYCKKYDENEAIIYSIFVETFLDGTPENTGVKEWIEKTPTMVITRAFEDIKDQSNQSLDGSKEETEGRTS